MSHSDVDFCSPLRDTNMGLVLAEHLLWALTKGQVTGRGHLTGADDGGHLTGVNDLPSAWRNGRTMGIEQHFY